MGRSVYLDDERQDVNEMLFFAFCHFRDGHWGEASWAFGETIGMLMQLDLLAQKIDEGEIDPDRVEGLKPPTSNGTGDWLSVGDLPTVNGASGESQ